MDYKCKIDELIKKIKKWGKKEDLIGKIKTEIKNEGIQLTDLDLRRILSISEVEKEDLVNDGADMSIPFSFVLSMFPIIVSFYFFSSENIETFEEIIENIMIFVFLTFVAIGSSVLMLVILSITNCLNKKKRMRITYIEIAIRELLDESKDEDKDEDKACNDLKKELEKEFKVFKNQNKKLINLTRKIEKNQNKKGLIDIFLGR